MSCTSWMRLSHFASTLKSPSATSRMALRSLAMGSISIFVIWLVTATPMVPLNTIAHTKIGSSGVTPNQCRKAQPASSDSAATSTSCDIQIRIKRSRRLDLPFRFFFTPSPPCIPRRASSRCGNPGCHGSAPAAARCVHPPCAGPFPSRSPRSRPSAAGA